MLCERPWCWIGILKFAEGSSGQSTVCREGESISRFITTLIPSGVAVITDVNQVTKFTSQNTLCWTFFFFLFFFFFGELSLAKQLSLVVWLYLSLLIYSLVDGYLGCF